MTSPTRILTPVLLAIVAVGLCWWLWHFLPWMCGVWGDRLRARRLRKRWGGG